MKEYRIVPAVGRDQGGGTRSGREGSDLKVPRFYQKKEGEEGHEGPKIGESWSSRIGHSVCERHANGGERA